MDKTVQPAEPLRPPRQALIVLGMHRSGTSMATRMLARLGAAMPQTLIGASPTNPLGHWESQPLQAFNDALLAEFGRHWEDCAALPDGWERQPQITAMQDEARALLRREFGAAPLFAYKDPRLCRLMPFWGRLIGEIAAPLPLLVVRPAEEVAASLEERNGLPREMGRLTWLRHVLGAEAATRGQRRAVLTFAALMDAPEAALASAGETLGLAWPISPAEAGLGALVQGALRHHESGSGDGWFGEAYAASEAIAAGDARGEARLDAIAAEFEASGAEFVPLCHQLSLALRGQRREKNQAIELAEAHEVGEARRIAAEREAARLAAQRHDDAAASTALRGQLGEAEARLAAQVDEILALSRLMLEVWPIREECTALRGARDGLAREVAQLRADIDTQQRALAAADRGRGRAERALAAAQLETEDRRQSQQICALLLALPRGRFESAKSHFKRLAAALAASGLFDSSAYHAANPDVPAGEAAAVQHVLRWGLAEGRRLRPVPAAGGTP